MSDTSDPQSSSWHWRSSGCFHWRRTSRRTFPANRATISRFSGISGGCARRSRALALALARTAFYSFFHSFFQTDRIFAPFGIDLTLHTHTALPAFLGATVLAPLSSLGAQNVVILASLALNGFAAYLLAFDRTGDRAGALVGDFVFAGSSYIGVHLL